jgi:hypothetical protein
MFLRFKTRLCQVSLAQLVEFSATAAIATMTELPPLCAPKTGQIPRTFQVMRCQNSPNAPNSHPLFFLLLFCIIAATPCSPPVILLISSGAGLLLWDSPTRTVILGQDYNHEWSDFGGKRDKTDRDAWHTASREAHEESLGVLSGHVVSRHKVIAQVSAVDHGVMKSTFASICLACCWIARPSCSSLHLRPLLFCGVAASRPSSFDSSWKVRAGSYECFLVDTTGSKICRCCCCFIFTAPFHHFVSFAAWFSRRLLLLNTFRSFAGSSTIWPKRQPLEASASKSLKCFASLSTILLLVSVG